MPSPSTVKNTWPKGGLTVGTEETAEISFKAETATEGLVYKIYEGEYENASLLVKLP